MEVKRALKLTGAESCAESMIRKAEKLVADSCVSVSPGCNSIQCLLSLSKIVRYQFSVIIVTQSFSVSSQTGVVPILKWMRS